MPKKLKLGVSATWESDTSGWGQGTTAATEDNWGGFSDNWNGTSDAHGPVDWGGGWGQPAPDLSAPDTFPSLGSSKPSSKRSKTQEPTTKQAPADFASLLGGPVSRPWSKGSSMAKQQQSYQQKQQPYLQKQQQQPYLQKQQQQQQPYLQKQQQPYKPPPVRATQKSKSAADHNPWSMFASPSPSPPPQPSSSSNKSFGDILNVSKSPSLTNTSGRQVLDSFKKPAKSEEPATKPDAIPTTNSPGRKVLETFKESPSETQQQVTKKEDTQQKDVKPIKPIYLQLQEQLLKVSSLGKPLHYIIQNGSITVQIVS